MLINSLYVIVCLIVLFLWVSFLYARVLVWEIWDPKFSERTSQLLDSLLLSSLLQEDFLWLAKASVFVP